MPEVFRGGPEPPGGTRWTGTSHTRPSDSSAQQVPPLGSCKCPHQVGLGLCLGQGCLGIKDPVTRPPCPLSPAAPCSQFCLLASWFLNTHQPGLRIQVLTGICGDMAGLQPADGKVGGTGAPCPQHTYTRAQPGHTDGHTQTHRQTHRHAHTHLSPLVSGGTNI